MILERAGDGHGKEREDEQQQKREAPGEHRHVRQIDLLSLGS